MLRRVGKKRGYFCDRCKKPIRPFKVLGNTEVADEFCAKCQRWFDLRIKEAAERKAEEAEQGDRDRGNSTNERYGAPDYDRPTHVLRKSNGSPIR